MRTLLLVDMKDEESLKKLIAEKDRLEEYGIFLKDFREVLDTTRMSDIQVTRSRIKTPRGELSIKKSFRNDTEAKKEGYGYYFSEDKYDIYTKHLDEYHVLFAVIPEEPYVWDVNRGIVADLNPRTTDGGTVLRYDENGNEYWYGQDGKKHYTRDEG